MDPARIATLLEPFVLAPLSTTQLKHISTCIDMLLRWNRKLNLTSVREPESIVTRHFGESIFAAQHLGPSVTRLSTRLVDVGSGAGFPGLPIKICFPEARVTLIESHQKKAVFLREVIRALAFTGIDVFVGRAQAFPPCSADLVTLRAVERFDEALPAAARLLRSTGRLALLVGASQVSRASALLPNFRWHDPIAIPLSAARLLLAGEYQESGEPNHKRIKIDNSGKD